jgi:hypothetical protein
MTKIASVLIAAMGMSDVDRRRDFLWENPVRIVRGAMVHRIAGFDRSSATWMTFCGVSYTGNAHEDEVPEGMTNCMACTVGR